MLWMTFSLFFNLLESCQNDTLSVTGYDPDHSVDEDRFVTFGMSNKNRLLVVSHTEEGDVIRILSCRPATTPERKIYEEG